MLVTFMIISFLIGLSAPQKDPGFKTKMMVITEECAAQEKVEKQAIEQFWTENHAEGTNQAIKCFFKCINQKLGVLDDGGDVVDEVLKEVAYQLTDDGRDREIVEECAGIEGDDLCETAFKLMICIRNTKLD